ncbi:hypothetical protein SEA_EVY_226 [Streptomyces phage Evy]|uniref:Uncharacterized protein n=3 Tax=Samistivirus TaxID=2560220 RepID=A0A221SBA1_9CAUD|nr:hypothetical protein AXJ18_gp078 [Streptomyces phage Jay2Jay]YP_010103569.1 hypothetical protein KNU67_gp072 [Streptomyces phage Evy]ASN73270.1 hypothetical protein SEA_WARPY_240 [Streptomyces phage Warpy]UEM46981.1 hypothetical protein SEA_TARGARYEN_236 [Streptomyces phage Targaryen]AIW02696.1 hypothetical protein PBI_JAY2JAY_243 [Streptomyces phage Jay2Jay]QDH94060.1 hypothetical protein SEA_EVY_226 [Streptomyces phage Evy]
MAEPKRPRIDFTAQERRTEINLLNDLKDAKKFKDVYPTRLAEAEQNLAELYALVEQRYRAEK